MGCEIRFSDYLEGVRNANIDDSDIELLVDELFYAELFIVIWYRVLSKNVDSVEQLKLVIENQDSITEEEDFFDLIDSLPASYVIKEICIALINLLIQKELDPGIDYTNAIIAVLIENNQIIIDDLSYYKEEYENENTETINTEKNVMLTELSNSLLTALSNSQESIVDTLLENYVDSITIPFSEGNVTYGITCADGYQGSPSIICNEDGSLTYSGCTAEEPDDPEPETTPSTTGSISGGTQHSSDYDDSFEFSWKHILGGILFVFIFLVIMSFVEIKKV